MQISLVFWVFYARRLKNGVVRFVWPMCDIGLVIIIIGEVEAKELVLNSAPRVNGDLPKLRVDKVFIAVI